MVQLNQTFVRGVIRQALLQCLPDAELGANKLSPLTETLLDSPHAKAVKEEIVAVGRKLWARQYVDGNGGNISYRISNDLVLCTPTLCSKGDLTIDDLCLVNLANQKIFGSQAHTSEILLHLEIYKAVPSARAVVHCHPPHATAYAIVGMVPPGLTVPEQEVFIGPVALAPYETPGTKTFAETVLPYVQTHNTILLANHGVVCWADTVTHAEWWVEIVDAYCRTLILAAQLGAPIQKIPPDKIAELLQIKKKLGLPDARLENVSQVGTVSRAGAKESTAAVLPHQRRDYLQDEAFESLVTSITDQVLSFVTKTKE